MTETEKDREREEKGTLVRESRPRVKRSRRIITATHPACILTGCNSLWINLKSTTGFSNIAMETAYAPHENLMTAARKVYRREHAQIV